MKLSERLLDVGGNLLVGFPVEELEVGNKVVLTTKFYVFKVSAWTTYFYNWNKLGALAKGGSSDLNYLGESAHGSGLDILRIERDDFQVYHIGMTPLNPNLRVYRTISPVGDVISALDRKKSSDLASVTSGSNYDYYTARQITDAFDPEVVAENLIFRAGSDDDGKSFQFGFYAEEAISANLPIYLVGRSYKLVPIYDDREKQKILDDAIIEPRERKVRTTSIIIGGINRAYSLAKFIPDSWEGSDIVYQP